MISRQMFQALARDRLERLNASPSATPWTYFRVYSTLLLVLTVDFLWYFSCPISDDICWPLALHSVSWHCHFVCRRTKIARLLMQLSLRSSIWCLWDEDIFNNILDNIMQIAVVFPSLLSYGVAIFL